MTCVAVLLVSAIWAVSKSAGQPQTSPAPPPKPEEILTQAGIATDTAGLIKYLLSRSVDDDLRNVDALCKQLGHPNGAKREEASRRLRRLSYAALIPLTQYRKSTDPEVARRVAALEEAILREREWDRQLAAIRVLALRAEDGALEALLAHLPFAVAGDNYGVTLRAIWAKSDAYGRLHPALKAALSNEFAVRRGVGAYAAGKWGWEAERARLHEMLKDPDRDVRVAAGRGLLDAGDDAPIREMLADANIKTRRCDGLATISGHKPGTVRMLPEVIRLLDEKDRDVVRFALNCLANSPVECHRDAVEPVLKQVARAGVGSRAFRTLGRLTGQRERVVPFLLRCLQDPRMGEMIGSISEALSCQGKSDPDGVVPRVIELLKHRLAMPSRSEFDEKVESHVVGIFRMTGPKAKGAVPLLVDLTRNGPGKLPEEAWAALGSVDPITHQRVYPWTREPRQMERLMSPGRC